MKMTHAVRPERGLMTRVTDFVMLGGLVCAFAGCGQGTRPVGPGQDASISGKVTYKGQPVTDARLSFENTDRGAYGTEFKGGSYSIPKLVSGEFVVTVTPVIGPMTMTPAADGSIPKPTERADIPKKYRTAAESGVKTTVKTGTNTYNLDMVD